MQGTGLTRLPIWQVSLPGHHGASWIDLRLKGGGWGHRREKTQHFPLLVSPSAQVLAHRLGVGEWGAGVGARW